MTRRVYEDYAYGDTARAECIWPMPQGDWPALEGDARAEVAVVGGGYTGLCAALHLAQAGVQVTLLEAHSPGWGASGRNGGFCCFGGDKLGLRAIRKRFGEDAAQAYFNAQRDAIDLVAHLLPYAGPVGDWENAWAGLNYHGNGVAMGSYVGARLADMALGTAPALPILSRTLPRFPLPAIRRSYLYPTLAAYRLKDGPPAG